LKYDEPLYTKSIKDIPAWSGDYQCAWKDKLWELIYYKNLIDVV
jgi:hypothetical protein